MTRRELRENVFKMLFRVEFHNVSDMNEQVGTLQENYFSMQDDDLMEIDLKEPEISEIQARTNAILSKVSEIDAKINDVSVGWKTSRMGKVDLSIIRLATYEILFDENVPAPVAINEAVELAKQFGTEESASFVNGILSKLIA